MENKLKTILAKKKCSEPDKIVSSFMRFLDRPIIVGFDFQEVSEFLDKGDEIKSFQKSELEELKEFNPKAIYVLFLLEKGSFNLDEIDKTCNDLDIDDVLYVVDIDNENKMEIIGIR
jgi:hypothetical protein